MGLLGTWVKTCAPGARTNSGRPGRCQLSGVRSADDGEHVARREDEVLLAGVLDLGAAVLAVDDLVADLDVERDPVAVVVDATRSDAEALALLGLLLGGVRDDQAGGCGLLGLQGLDDDPVLERLDVDRHCCRPPLSPVGSAIGSRLVSCWRHLPRRAPSRESHCSAGCWHPRVESANANLAL